MSKKTLNIETLEVSVFYRIQKKNKENNYEYDEYRKKEYISDKEIIGKVNTLNKLSKDKEQFRIVKVTITPIYL